jgi:hypothetical protein
MAKVVGVGGVFFKSSDPEKLGAWYQKWLEVPVEPPYGASFKPDTVPAGGLTVWAPFTKDTDYFSPSQRDYMFNLMVDDLDGALAQVRQGGAEIVGDDHGGGLRSLRLVRGSRGQQGGAVGAEGRALISE